MVSLMEQISPLEQDNRLPSSWLRPRTWLHRFRAAAPAAAIGLALSPVAAILGMSETEVNDNLGPHEAAISLAWGNETTVELGPLGNLHWPRSVGGVLGLDIKIGGVADIENPEKLITAYVGTFEDPKGVTSALSQKLERSAARDVLLSEAELAGLIVCGSFLKYGLTPEMRRQLSAKRLMAASLGASAAICGILTTPAQPEPQQRIAITSAANTPLDGMTADNPLLAWVLNKGVSEARVLYQRQLEADKEYVDTARLSLIEAEPKLAKPTPNQVSMIGISDMHCNEAMLTLAGYVSILAAPSAVWSSGDDTTNGMSSEKGCVNKEVNIAHQIGVPFIDVKGNHDSKDTVSQFKNAGAVELEGHTVAVEMKDRTGNIVKFKFLGDGDPEHNPPFSMERVQDRPETEVQMGARLAEENSNDPADIVLVHQPTAAEAIIEADKQGKVPFVAWGHMHTEYGPIVHTHLGTAPSRRTIAMQLESAGGVKEPSITEFSTPITPPRTTAGVYQFFYNKSTHLLEAMQPDYFSPEGKVTVGKLQTFSATVE
jgi:hypothetical protein